MPQPTPGDVHVNRLLTDISVAYLQDSRKFVADQMFSRVPVQKQSDLYATYSQADFQRDDMQRRAPGSETAGVGYRVSNTSYLCEVWGLHIDVDDQTVANADNPFYPMRDASMLLTQKELIKREVRFVTKFFGTSIWTGGVKASGAQGDLVAGTDFVAWNDVASTPIENIMNQQANVESATGFLPNKLTLNRRGWFALRNHPDTIERVKFTSDGPVTTDIVARLCELDKILIAAGVQNTAQEGLTTSTSYIAGNHALLAYVPPSPSLLQPAAGYTFVWNGYLGMAEGRRIKNYRIEALGADRVEIEATWDMKVIAAPLGVFFQNVTS